MMYWRRLHTIYEIGLLIENYLTNSFLFYSLSFSSRSHFHSLDKISKIVFDMQNVSLGSFIQKCDDAMHSMSQAYFNDYLNQLWTVRKFSLFFTIFFFLLFFISKVPFLFYYIISDRKMLLQMS